MAIDEEILSKVKQNEATLNQLELNESSLNDVDIERLVDAFSSNHQYCKVKYLILGKYI